MCLVMQVSALGNRMWLAAPCLRRDMHRRNDDLIVNTI